MYPQLSINGQIIKNINKVKYLGMTLDSNLTSESHTTYKQALKLFDGKSLNHHHCNVLSKYSFSSFENLILLSEVRLVFKIIHNAVPPQLQSFFQLSSEQMSRTSQSALNSDLHIPLRQTTFA